LNLKLKLTEIKIAKFFNPIGNSENISLTITSVKSLKDVILLQQISIRALFEKVNEKAMILQLNFEIK